MITRLSDEMMMRISQHGCYLQQEGDDRKAPYGSFSEIYRFDGTNQLSPVGSPQVDSIKCNDIKQNQMSFANQDSPTFRNLVFSENFSQTFRKFD